MSTTYFLYNKGDDAAQPPNIFIPPSKGLTYILPSNNLDYYARNGLFESSLIDWCKIFQNESKLFLDIGAHTGTYSISLANHFKGVHCFEPQRMTYYALCGSVAMSGLQNIKCHNFGLGSSSQVGSMTLNIISNDGGGSSVHARSQPVLATEQIEIRMLDDLDLGAPIGFIKMDVEDNELNVLKGAVNTLKASNYPPILFENNHTNKDIFAFLKEIGYTIVNISGYSNMYLASYVPATPDAS